jgi:hypothetical protein
MLRVVVSTMTVKPSWEAMRDQLREHAALAARNNTSVTNNNNTTTSGMSTSSTSHNGGNALDELVSLFTQLSDEDAARAYQTALLPPVPKVCLLNMTPLYQKCLYP